MHLRMDGWKVSFDGSRAKIISGPCWAPVTCYRAYAGRDVPGSHEVIGLFKEMPNLERLVAKFQYPAPGSVRRYDFAYGRMACAVAAGHAESSSEFEGGCEGEYGVDEYGEEPGIETVYRKVDVVRLNAAEVRDLYLEWAHSRILHQGDEASLDFALHVLAEMGGAH